MLWMFEKGTTICAESERFKLLLHSSCSCNNFFKTPYMEKPPLILTLALNAEAETFFDTLRRKHFPPARNFLTAHVTLFHHLPPAEPQVIQDVSTICAQQGRFFLRVVDVTSLGRGVAYKLESAQLQQLHKQWQQKWQPWLTPQDRQLLRPHVTVQNKVAPQTARDLLHELKTSFSPFDVQGLGMRLWRYLNGPWELVRFFPFEGE